MVCFCSDPQYPIRDGPSLILSGIVEGGAEARELFGVAKWFPYPWPGKRAVIMVQLVDDHKPVLW
jgi:hypothetical protein